MKKILIFLLLATFFSSCAVKKELPSYTPPTFPNSQVTENNLKSGGLEGQEINPQSLVSTYTTFDSEARLIRDSGLETNEEVKGGGLFIEGELKGSSIYVPLSYPVLWDTGEGLKGTPVTGPLEGTNLRPGEIMRGPFMAEIKNVEQGGPGGYIERLFIQLRDDTIGDIFSYRRTPLVGQDKFYKANKSSAGNFQPLRDRKKEVLKNQNTTPDDYVYVIELLAFQPDMNLKPGYFVEKSTNLVYYDNGKARFYFTEGSSGNFWLVPEINKYHRVSAMYIKKKQKDNQKVEVINSKILGID